MSEAKEQNDQQPKDKGEEPTWLLNDSIVKPGRQLGQFHIERQLGRGGAGVVYLAHDTKLNRSVAIKSLPAELMKNSKARTRFAREARVLASLNHPNIATIYDELQEAEGLGYLILEYVPGQTLAERIARAKLKPQEALSIAQQIAEAVGVAHEHEVIHRDLKPGNVKITPEGNVKVLDFGLAKTFSHKTIDQDSTVTEFGRVIGTPAYMSPEQARGIETDKRCDIWSFGCILYEMLTGKVPFKGDTVSDTLAAILDREPDWHALPQATPVNIQILMRRCLEKDPRRRLHDITDAAIEISETLAGDSETFALPGKVLPAPRFFRRDVIFVALVCLISGLCIGSYICVKFFWPITSESSVLWLPLKVPARLYSGVSPNCFVTISPDGTRIAYVGESDDGNPRLYMWSKDDPDFKPIGGTMNAHNPFFSPNSQWIGFFTDKQLKRVSVDGGEPHTLDPNVPEGHSAFGSWVDEKTIIFSRSIGDRGLWQISLDTGHSTSLVAPDSENERAYYRYPQVLPGDKAILYTNIDPNGSSIWAYRPTTRQSQLVLDNASYARYVNSGHLIFVQDNVLRVAPFDLEQLTAGRGVRLIKDDVGFEYGKLTPQVAISNNGTAVYISGYELDKRELVWVDHQGNCTPLEVGSHSYESPCLDPNDQRIAVGIRSQKNPNIRVYVYDIQLKRPVPFKTEGESCYPQWSPDGTEIAFWGWGHESKGKGVFYKGLGDTGTKQLASELPSGVYLHPYSWSKDRLACQAMDSNTLEDIWVVDTNDGKEPKCIFGTNDREYNPALSPDGHLIAYVLEKESDQPQIFLREYSGIGQGWAVSTLGATSPVWSSNGEELYYISDDRRMMAVDVTPDNYTTGKPYQLFKLPDDIELRSGHLVKTYDVSKDGRFLMLKRSEVKEDKLIFVQNWFKELKAIAPPKED